MKASRSGRAGGRPITIGITNQQSRQLLEKLAKDDAFRVKFKTNPRKELARFNIHAPAERFPAKIKLPPKRKFEAALRRLERPLFFPIKFDFVFFVFSAFMPKVLKKMR